MIKKADYIGISLPAEILVPVQHEFIKSTPGHISGWRQNKISGYRHGGFYRVGIAKIPICHCTVRDQEEGEVCTKCHKYIASEDEILNTLKISK